MPKSKVRKKPALAGATNRRTPQKVKAGPSNPIYVAVMLGLMLAGLAWLVVNYIAAEHISWMSALGPWNFAIGFGLMVVGLLMTMRWR
ncbi:MAG: cell division protein CrgA [Mycobacteriaceae bacterium]